MNHIVEKQENPVEKVSAQQTVRINPLWFLSLVFFSMALHSLVAYANRPFQTNILFELLFGAVNFAVVLMIYYGISRIAFAGQFLFLGIAALVSVSVGAFLTKDVPAVTMGAGWMTVILSSLVCGVLASKKIALAKVFAFSLGVLAVFASIQLFPLWAKLFESAADLVNLMVDDISENLLAWGYSEAKIQSIGEQMRVISNGMLRILPAMSLMAAMFQFAIAFWFFARWLSSRGAGYANFPSFILWKIPFVLTPALLIAVSMRLLGNDLMVLIADNLILILAMVYSIAGIALLEFFMKKFRFGVISRIIIYFLFLVTHVVGFAFLAVAGFIDSFFDWRRKYPLPLDIKTG